MSTIEVKDCYQSKYVVTAQGISKHKSNLPKSVCGYSASFGRGDEVDRKAVWLASPWSQNFACLPDNVGVYLKIETSGNLDLNEESWSPYLIFKIGCHCSSSCCQFVTEQWYHVFYFHSVPRIAELISNGSSKKKKSDIGVLFWILHLNSSYSYLFARRFLHIKSNILLIIYVANKFSQFVAFSCPSGLSPKHNIRWEWMKSQ